MQQDGTTDLRVRVLTLAAGQNVPWHLHSDIADSFVGLEGVTIVETRSPDQVMQLQPGQRCTVEAKTPHLVHGLDDGPCKFMIIQGVGVYNFVPVDG